MRAGRLCSLAGVAVLAVLTSSCMTYGVNHVAQELDHVGTVRSGGSRVFLAGNRVLLCLDNGSERTMNFLFDQPAVDGESRIREYRFDAMDRIPRCDTARLSGHAIELRPCPAVSTVGTRYDSAYDYFRDNSAGQCFAPLNTAGWSVYVENDGDDLVALNDGIEGTRKPWAYGLLVLSVPIDVITLPLQAIVILPYWAICSLDDNGCR